MKKILLAATVASLMVSGSVMAISVAVANGAELANNAWVNTDFPVKNVIIHSQVYTGGAIHVERLSDGYNYVCNVQGQSNPGDVCQYGPAAHPNGDGNLKAICMKWDGGPALARIQHSGSSAGEEDILYSSGTDGGDRLCFGSGI